MSALELLEQGDSLRQQLSENTRYFRQRMGDAGFDVIEGEHPIVPIMIGDAKLAQSVTSEMMKQGVYVTAFSFPVVPQGMARVRTQMSAAHSRDQLDHAIDGFISVGKKLGLLSSGA